MTAKIEPWMMQASNDIEDAYAIAIEKETYVTEPAALDIAAIIAAHAPKQEPSVPDGWKLVPLSPTKEMIDAIHNGWKDAQPDGEYDGEKTTSMYAMHVAAYKAGVKAAPEQLQRLRDLEQEKQP